MNKQTVALIALFAGWILAADMADATTYKDVAGRWCGDVTDYVFAPDTLTVKFHDARPANMFKITKYTYTNDAYVLIGSTVPAKSQSRFSPNSSATIPKWRSSRTATNRAERSTAAETLRAPAVKREAEEDWEINQTRAPQIPTTRSLRQRRSKH